MSYLVFIAALIGALAWPAAVIAVAVMFRASLGSVLLDLTRLKYKDTEIDFGRELSQIEAQARSIGVTPKPVPIPAADHPKDSAGRLRETARLGNQFSETAVALGWSAVELELEAAATRPGLAGGQAGRRSDLCPPASSTYFTRAATSIARCTTF